MRFDFLLCSEENQPIKVSPIELKIGIKIKKDY